MKNFLINNDAFKDLLSDSPIIIIDGGARDELFEPFNLVEKSRIKVVKFEADVDAFVEKNENVVIYHKALWKDESPIQLHIANEPSTSSVYPPNMELLKQFDDEFGVPVRKTSKIVELQGTSVDIAFSDQNFKPDFLKLDIHSAEYEALLGSSNMLETTIFSVLVETWTLPIHVNQKLNSDVERFLNDKMFYIFDVKHIFKWKFKKDNEYNIQSKKQIIGFENLFFKKIELLNDKIPLIKYMLIAELYGFPNLAINCCDRLEELSLVDSHITKLYKDLIVNNNEKFNFLTKIKKRLGAIKRALTFPIEELI